MGRADNVVAVGDLVEMLLNVVFACKDGMLDWDWRGIDTLEWSPQRLDWEIYRTEHLAFPKYMEYSMDGWLSQSCFVFYAALRSMAVLDWTVSHSCPM